MAGAVFLPKGSKKIDKEVFEQSLDMITRQVDDIHHLVNEFSSFARMPSPKLKLINLICVPSLNLLA